MVGHWRRLDANKMVWQDVANAGTVTKRGRRRRGTK